MSFCPDLFRCSCLFMKFTFWRNVTQNPCCRPVVGVRLPENRLKGKNGNSLTVWGRMIVALSCRKSLTKHRVCMLTSCVLLSTDRASTCVCSFRISGRGTSPSRSTMSAIVVLALKIEVIGHCIRGCPVCLMFRYVGVLHTFLERNVRK